MARSVAVARTAVTAVDGDPLVVIAAVVGRDAFFATTRAGTDAPSLAEITFRFAYQSARNPSQYAEAATKPRINSAAINPTRTFTLPGVSISTPLGVALSRPSERSSSRGISLELSTFGRLDANIFVAIDVAPIASPSGAEPAWAIELICIRNPASSARSLATSSA